MAPSYESLVDLCFTASMVSDTEPPHAIDAVTNYLRLQHSTHQSPNSSPAPLAHTCTGPAGASGRTSPTSTCKL